MTTDLSTIGPLQRQCLRIVTDGDWHSAAGIATELDTTSRRVSESLLKLTKRDIAERRINPRRPRGYLYRLSDSGRQLDICDLCGQPHNSTAGVMQCCSERLDDDHAASVPTTATPAPATPNGGVTR